METAIEIKKSNDRYKQSVVALLQSENLPVEDLKGDMQNFLVALENETIVGAIGLETYDEYGLLRSLIVHKDYRNKNLAARLIQQLEEMAFASGITSIYLLTETAQAYFAKKGFKTITREEVPTLLKQSTEFSHVCPQSAIVMKKVIE